MRWRCDEQAASTQPRGSDAGVRGAFMSSRMKGGCGADTVAQLFPWFLERRAEGALCPIRGRCNRETGEFVVVTGDRALIFLKTNGRMSAARSFLRTRFERRRSQRQ